MATEKRARPETHGHDHGHHHRDVSGGWLRPAVFGAMDGLVTNVSLIAGVGGGGGGHGAIVLTGIAGLIAGAFSMATGEYISVTNQNELVHAEVSLERQMLSRFPAAEQDELAGHGIGHTEKGRTSGGPGTTTPGRRPRDRGSTGATTRWKSMNCLMRSTPPTPV